MILYSKFIKSLFILFSCFVFLEIICNVTLSQEQEQKTLTIKFDNSWKQMNLSDDISAECNLAILEHNKIITDRDRLNREKEILTLKTNNLLKKLQNKKRSEYTVKELEQLNEAMNKLEKSKNEWQDFQYSILNLRLEYIMKYRQSCDSKTKKYFDNILKVDFEKDKNNEKENEQQNK
ncbi:MAG: hypothetical protein PHE84_04260 [bacterium]|nr:hypothetical protein [bacterium]